mmetsp:Transcript_15421/g.21485  ORF Transcript_15421/g.21485 Transcript_15421/m.21485 type:complete len:419 (+) Transcript_15421:66-1322(+)
MIQDGVPVASLKLMDRELGVDAIDDSMKKIIISSRNRRRQQFLFLPNIRGIVFFLALAFFCDTAKSFSLIADDSSSSCSTAGQKTCIVLRDEKWNTVGKEIANELSLPSYLETDLEEESEFTHGLCIIDYQSTYAVALQDLQSSDAQRSSSKGKRRQSAATKKKKKKNLSQPFFIDFCPPTNSKLGKRFGGQSGTDLLVKAVAPNKFSSIGSCAFVYDLTAGFGQDSVMLAQSGANVHMVERDPIVYTLLNDALRRLRLVAARSDGGDSEGIQEETDSTRVQRASILLEKLSLENGEAYEVCQKTNRNLVTASSVTAACPPDICYLDPMFPPRTKSAAVKKNMQLLHGLLDTQVEQGPEEDNSSHAAGKDLLEAAYAIAQSRVVVKRPINAPPLGNNIALKPSYDVRGKVNRWDVYIK